MLAKGSKQTVTQVSTAHLWQSQPGSALMKARGFSTAGRIAITMNHLSLALYHQVVSEGFLSRWTLVFPGSSWDQPFGEANEWHACLESLSRAVQPQAPLNSQQLPAEGQHQLTLARSSSHFFSLLPLASFQS